MLKRASFNRILESVRDNMEVLARPPNGDYYGRLVHQVSLDNTLQICANCLDLTPDQRIELVRMIREFTERSPNIASTKVHEALSRLSVDD